MKKKKIEETSVDDLADDQRQRTQGGPVALQEPAEDDGDGPTDRQLHRRRGNRSLHLSNVSVHDSVIVKKNTFLASFRGPGARDAGTVRRPLGDGALAQHPVRHPQQVGAILFLFFNHRNKC